MDFSADAIVTFYLIESLLTVCCEYTGFLFQATAITVAKAKTSNNVVSDGNGDGIGDTPYVIDVDNMDRYPLMLPWYPIKGDIDYDGKVGLADLVLLAKAYGSRPGYPNWNPSGDIQAPYGVIGLPDLVTLATNYGEHYP